MPDNSKPLCELDPTQAHHAQRVLRLGPDAPIELFDGQGHTAPAIIVQADRRKVQCRVGKAFFTPAAATTLTVATALPKGSRAEDLVNQLTQLGADEVVPLNCDRSVVDARPNKIERLNKAALAATKQCQRAHMLTVQSPISFSDALARAAAASAARLLSPAAAPWPPASIQHDLAAADNIWLLVGPEGGWSDAELAAADNAQIKRWSLNPNVLRIETAATAAAAILRYATFSLPENSQPLSL